MIMPEPDISRTSGADAGSWDEVRPEGIIPRYEVEDRQARARCVAGLRELAGFLEGRAEIPVPTDKCISIFVDGTPAEKRAQVDYAGRLLGEPVRDDTADGGHYSVSRSFGPFEYEVIATGVGQAVYAVGDDVRLVHDAGRVARASSLAQAGYVTHVREDDDGTYSYTVHFPGRAGDQRGWSRWSLAYASFEPVGLSTGTVTSIRDAERLLIDLGARAGLTAGQGHGGNHGNQAVSADFVALTAALESVLGIGRDDLIRQLEPQFGRRFRELRPGTRNPAAVAADDVAGQAQGTVPAVPDEELDRRLASSLATLAIRPARAGR
jgi:hypothetical protein